LRKEIILIKSYKQKESHLRMLLQKGINKKNVCINCKNKKHWKKLRRKKTKLIHGGR
jgi:hypothetical protein